MPQLSLLTCLLATVCGRLRDHRAETGSISVEQVLITAGLVTITIGALAAIAAGVAKYASRI